MIDFATSVLVLMGSLLFLIAAIGVLRWPDVFTRMHAAAKASSLGLGLILSGTALHLQSIEAFAKSALAVFFVFLTTPIAAHILARAAFLSEETTGKNSREQELKNLYADESSTVPPV